MSEQKDTNAEKWGNQVVEAKLVWLSEEEKNKGEFEITSKNLKDPDNYLKSYMPLEFGPAAMGKLKDVEYYEHKKGPHEGEKGAYVPALIKGYLRPHIEQKDGKVVKTSEVFVTEIEVLPNIEALSEHRNDTGITIKSYVNYVTQYGKAERDFIVGQTSISKNGGDNDQKIRSGINTIFRGAAVSTLKNSAGEAGIPRKGGDLPSFVVTGKGFFAASESYGGKAGLPQLIITEAKEISLVERDAENTISEPEKTKEKEVKVEKEKDSSTPTPFDDLPF